MKPDGAVRLHVEPVTLAFANQFVVLVHRHHGETPAFGNLWCVAAVDESGVCHGVATAAFPLAANRLRDGFRCAEVTRVATDGTPNACSVLYAACARAAADLGFSRILTYLLDWETGVSVRAAGWVQDEGEFGNKSWIGHGGKDDRHRSPKGRFSKYFSDGRPPLRLPDELIEMQSLADPQEVLPLETTA